MDLLINNTYNFVWAIQQKNPDGSTSPYDLTGKDLTIVIEQNDVRRLEISHPSVSNNVASFTWQGKDQHVPGPFRIILIENDGKDNMYSVDTVEPFRLVRTSIEIRERRAPMGITATTIELASTISAYPDQAIPDTIARVAWVNGQLAHYYEKGSMDDLLSRKVDKIPGKGLSSNDYTNEEKQKLEGIEAGADVNIIEGIQKNGSDLTPNNSKKVNITVPTRLSELDGDSSHRLVTDEEKNAYAAKYNKPGTGIPKSDLSEEVKNSLQKADSAYQKPGNGIPSSDMASAVQDALSAAGTALQPADIVTLSNKVAALESLISEDGEPTAAIDKFNEIVAFLATITNTQTLAGIVSGINNAIAAKYTKPGTGIPKADLEASVQASLEKADSALQQHQDISGLASKAASPVAGHFAKLNANGDPVDAGYDADRIHRDLGYNANQSVIQLALGVSGKYVKCATRSAEANANFAISQELNVDACSELLIKTGYNPSDGNHAALDISVIAIVEELQRVRTVQKKDGSNNPLYYETDEEGNPTATETTTVTDYLVFIQESYTEKRYLPNNEDRFVAIPDSGYYIANIPQSCKCVISYKPGVTDMNVIVVKHGALANLTSQIFGIYEHRVMVEAITALATRIDALEKHIRRLGDVTAGTIDAIEYKKYMAPLVLLGNGAPSASVTPDNWPEELPWDGVPVFKGQIYLNYAAASGGLYYAKNVSAVADWINA